MSFVDNDKKIVWQNGATGGTPMSAENLNKVNEETSNAFDKMNSSVDSRIAGLKNSLVGSQATEVVKDAENVTKTLNGKPLTGNGGIFENDGVTAKNSVNVTSAINGKPVSGENGIFEDDGVTVKKATNSDNAEKATNDSDGNNIITTYATNIFHPIKYTKINITSPTALFYKDDSITIQLEEAIEYGVLYEIYYRNYDLNLVNKCYMVDQGGSFDVITPMITFTFNTTTDRTLRDIKFSLQGSMNGNVLTLTIKAAPDASFPSRGAMDNRINILAIYKVEGLPSIR